MNKFSKSNFIKSKKFLSCNLINLLKAGLVVFLAFNLLACSTTEDSPEDDILSEVAEEASAIEEGAEASSEDEFAEEGSEEGAADQSNNEGQTEDEFAEEGFGDDEFADEDFGEDEFADEDFGEEEPLEQGATEDSFAEENFEEEPLQEEPLEEEPLQATNEEGDAKAVTIQNIKYISNKQGGAIEIVTSGEATFKTRMNEVTNQYIIEVANAELPEKLKRPYIMKEFEGAFAAINAYQDPSSKTARVVIQLKEAFEPNTQLEGNSIVVLPSQQMNVATGEQGQEAFDEETPTEELSEEGVAQSDEFNQPPPTQAWNAYEKSFVGRSDKILSARTLDDFLTGDNQFYGKRLSIEINDSEVREVIKFIAEFSGANIVLSEDVKGKVSIKLRQVPWDQALVTVMRVNNLGYIREGNVLRISNLKTLQAESQAADAIVKAQRGLAPLKVKVIPVSFALVKDLEKQIQKFLTKDRGQVVSDDRTSSLIVTDTIDVLERISRLVKELDIPPAQVLIEGKIVEASETFVKQVGVNWGFGGAQVNLGDGAGYKGGPLNLNTGLSVRPVSDKIAGAATTSLDLTVGTLNFLGNLTATLALAETDQLVKVVSAPRILAMNREKAVISQKGQVVDVIQTVQPNSGVIIPSIERKDVVLQLEVTPQITSNGSVILDVDVLRQFPGADLGEGTREINSRQAKTKVLVKNGQTAVIGGIYQNDITQTSSGTPGLRNIPFLGWLFKGKTEDNRKNELLLFLTPRILNAKDQKAKEISS